MRGLKHDHHASENCFAECSGAGWGDLASYKGTKGEKNTQRADHYQSLYEAASAGRCGHSGLPLPQCKADICDCFDFEWISSEPAPKKLNKESNEEGQEQ